ncbi:MAG: hypothetical protein LH618_17655, partial [Saprospiraceae bacterium]|nr:hypothetical protein [Saprospiraceae bacterium]
MIGKNPPESGLYGLVKHGRPTKKPTFAMQQVVAYQWKIKIADNMEAMQFEMTSSIYLAQFHATIGNGLDELVRQFDFNGQKIDLAYQTQISAVYSSNIEGN